MTDIFFSAEQKVKLENELQALTTVKRTEVANEIEMAKSHGDLKENSEYHAAREKQAKIEDRIREVEHLLRHGQVITKGSGDHVVVGSDVVVKNLATGSEHSYSIVGTEEQDIMQGKISNTSPIASALLGSSVDDEINVTTPTGTITFKVIKIS